MGDTGTLNDPLFARSGANPNEKIVDLKIDPSCNAWAVTFTSGPDSLCRACEQDDRVSVRADGKDSKKLTDTTEKGRMALGPDGKAYHVTVYPVAAEVRSYPLPTTL